MTRAAAILCLLAASLAFAKDKEKEKPKAAPAGPPVSASTGTYYPVPPEVAVRIRALQHKNDMLEIENQRMQIKIEQNREQQIQLIDQMQNVAFEYASEKHIDLALFQLDAGSDDLKFVPKKKAP